MPPTHCVSHVWVSRFGLRNARLCSLCSSAPFSSSTSSSSAAQRDETEAETERQSATPGSSGTTRMMDRPLLETYHRKKLHEAKVFDFQRDEAQAQAKHEEWNSKFSLHVPNLWKSHAKRVRAVYLPFWRFSATVDTSVYCSDGKSNAGRENFYNNSSSYLSPEDLVYEEKDRKYSFGDEGMEIYASYALRRDFVQKLGLRSSDLEGLRPITKEEINEFAAQQMAQIEREKEGSRKDPKGRSESRRSFRENGTPKVVWDACNMKPSVAWHLAMRNIRKMQFEAALEKEEGGANKGTHKNDGNFAKKNNNKKKKNLQVHLKVRHRKMDLVYLPAYVLDYTYGTAVNISQERKEQSFQAVVGGTTESGVMGERHFSSLKAQLATGSFCTAVVALDYFASHALGLSPFSPELSLTSTLVLCGLSSVAARSAISMRRQESENKIAETEDESYDYNRLHDESILQKVEENEWRRWEESEKWRWNETNRKKWADNLFFKQNKRRKDLKSHFEKLQVQRMIDEEEARRESAREKRYGKKADEGGHSSGLEYRRGVDFMGFYRLMGLGDKLTSATEQEIKDAFRKEALRLHPDRWTGHENKERAEEDFKKLQKAYTVLRDPEKRQMYHGGKID